MTVDVTPLIVAAIYSLVPIVLGFLANLAFKAVWPTIVAHVGKKDALLLQESVNHVLNAGIGFAVQHAAAAVTARGAIDLNARNWMVDLAVKYATDHAPDLMTQAGDVVEKVLARFDMHPAVQGLVAAANDNAAAQTNDIRTEAQKAA